MKVIMRRHKKDLGGHHKLHKTKPITMCLLFCAALLSLPVVHSADPAASDLKSDVLEWVDQLDGSTAKERKAAERALIDAGPNVLLFLPQPNAGLSMEASDRLARVRETLEAAKAAEQTEAISIRLDQVKTLADALEAISRDSEIDFEYNGDKSVAVQSIKTPLSFWHAVDFVLDQADLDINFYGGDRETLLLVKRSEGRPSRVDSSAYTGVYRIEPTAVTSRRSLLQPNLNALNLSLEISWEPRLTPIGLSIPIAQLRGQLDDRETLKPQPSGETIDIATGSELAQSEFFLPMQLPAGQPEKIATLSGIIKALLPGKRQSFELSLGETGAKEKLDSMEVMIESIRKNGPLHEIRIGVALQDAGRSLESHRQWIFENRAFVRRSDGSKAEHLGYEVYRQTSGGVGIGYLFDLGDSPSDSTFVYESPTAVVENEVSFLLQDIPLP